MKIEYIQIDRLEAMAMIDGNNIENLYYAYEYYSSSYGFGNDGWTIHCPSPRDYECGELIQYHSVAKKKRLFRKEVLNEPEVLEKTPYYIPLGHLWFKKVMDYEGKRDSQSPPLPPLHSLHDIKR